MTTKTNGLELKAFYTDEAFWPPSTVATAENVWHEDEEILVDGQPLSADSDIASIPDAAKVSISGGQVYGPKWDRDDGPSFEGYFKQWRRVQNTVFLSVAVGKDKEAELRKLLADFGAKVA